MRIPTPWVIAFLGVSLAGVSIDAVRAKRNASGSASLALSMASFVSATNATPAPLVAAVLLQAADCTGNLRMLNLLHRRDVRSAISLSVIWFVGAPGDTSVIRALLPAWTRAVPLRSAPHDVMRELARFGHRSTPVLLMLDNEGRIRLTTQSPRSAREFAGLQRIITGLTWSEER